LEHSPHFALEPAADIARRLYGRKDRVASELPSGRDQNFLIDASDGQRFVLKIASALEEPVWRAKTVGQ
jgi:Ser/Thr protein kinase RdoA (MazF antagonist)